MIKARPVVCSYELEDPRRLENPQSIKRFLSFRRTVWIVACKKSTERIRSQ